MAEKKTQGEEIFNVYSKALATDFEYAMLDIGCAIATQLERIANNLEPVKHEIKIKPLFDFSMDKEIEP